MFLILVSRWLKSSGKSDASLTGNYFSLLKIYLPPCDQHATLHHDVEPFPPLPSISTPIWFYHLIPPGKRGQLALCRWSLTPTRLTRFLRVCEHLVKTSGDFCQVSPHTCKGLCVHDYKARQHSQHKTLHQHFKYTLAAKNSHYLKVFLFRDGLITTALCGRSPECCCTADRSKAQLAESLLHFAAQDCTGLLRCWGGGKTGYKNTSRILHKCFKKKNNFPWSWKFLGQIAFTPTLEKGPTPSLHQP